MKKKLLVFLITILWSLNTPANAQELPYTSKTIDRCIKIVNIADFEGLEILYSLQSKPTLEIYTQGECLIKIEDQDILNLYWTTNNKLISLVLSKTEPDNKNIFFITDELATYPRVIGSSIPLESEIIEYKIIGFQDKTLFLHKHKQTSIYSDGRPNKDIYTQNVFFQDLSLVTPNLDSIFTDITEDHENYEAINYIKEANIVSGYTDGSFRPSDNISRAEFLKIIIGTVFSEDEIKACITEEEFRDINRNEWAYKYACIGRTKDIINGYSDNTFKPNNFISFIESAKIIANAFNYQVAENDIWFIPYIIELSKRNAIPLSIENYQDYLNRATMAEIIYRLSAKIIDKDSRTFEELYNSENL